jgi:predicted Zn-dependent peptidase
MNLLVDAGYASDQFAAPGTAALAMNMMDEGTEKLSTLEINEKLQLLGASLYSGSDLDHSFVSMNTLKPSLDQSLDLFAEVVLNPAFPQSELDRLKKEQIVRIQREKSQPIQMALRVIPQYLYGTGHAYSLPLTGSGYENTVGELKREDIVSFYQSWMKPNNATLVVVGDIELDYLTGKLEDLFGSWKPGDVPEKNIAQVKTAQKNTLYLMDRPESEQSVILAGHLTNPYGEVSEIARETMINVLGGEFTSRINMNLREDKHWAYGAGGFVWNAKGQRPLMVYAPVQTDKTSESVAELIKEVNAFVGDQPITAEELEKVNTNNILALPGSWETNGAVANSINSIVKYELADDYYQTYDQEVRNLTLDQVRETSNTMIQPSELNWFIVGDKAKIMEGLEQIGFSEIVEIDADGKPLGLGGKIELE